MYVELTMRAETETEQRRLDKRCGFLTEGMPQAQQHELGAIPYPRQMIESVCHYMGFDETDSRYMHDMFRRHETGEATRPERLLLHLVMSLLTSRSISVECPETEEESGHSDG